MPRKGFGNFGTYVCVQSDRWIMYIVSLSADLADPNPGRDTYDYLCGEIRIWDIVET